MTDRELLEMAARAAGVRVERSRNGLILAQCINSEKRMGAAWNPLTDDGDAFRLAVKLGIHLTNSSTDAWATTLTVTVTQSIGSDPYAATRRAVVRAAAAIGSKQDSARKEST